MKLTFEQQKVFERALALEKRWLWFSAAIVFLALVFFGWLIWSGNWQNWLLLTMFNSVVVIICATAAGWLFQLCKELRGVLIQLINADAQALAQQYEKKLGLGDSESIEI
jgi:MFS superfamily sulfate permease-like transporter